MKPVELKIKYDGLRYIALVNGNVCDSFPTIIAARSWRATVNHALKVVGHEVILVTERSE